MTTDNLNITQGTGTVVGADQCTVNSVLVLLQEVKVALGGKGAFQDFLKQGVQTIANSISVCLASDEARANILTAGSNKGVQILQTDDYVIINNTPCQVLFAPVAVSGSGDNQIIAAHATKKTRILAIDLTINAAVNLKLRSDTTDITGLSYGPQQGWGLVRNFSRAGWCENHATNKAINLNLSGAVAVGGCVVYAQY